MQQTYLEFQNSLIHNLREHPDVLGLVFLGSSADTTRADEWSDHDFFVVTHSGKQEFFRKDLSWLPHHEAIVLSLRDTAHGLQVLYDSGRLLEFAVFDVDELSAYARANAFSVAFDKADITKRMQEAVQPTQSSEDLPPRINKMLTAMVVCVGRYARGERFNARSLFESLIIPQCLYLLKRVTPPEVEVTDNLDLTRRLEQSHPALADFLEQTRKLPLLEAVKQIIDTVESACQDQFSKKAAEVVRNLIKGAEQ
jgi:hypothetical protein